jgi:hypothetical protein
MEWDMRESTSHRERRIVVCTLGSGAGLRVASSFGRNGVSSSILSFSVLEGNRDINGWGDGEGCEFSHPVTTFLDEYGSNFWPERRTRTNGLGILSTVATVTRVTERVTSHQSHTSASEWKAKWRIMEV